MRTPANGESGAPSTADKSYADRLSTLSGARWKKILHVQAPFRAHIRHLALGRTLDVGCGTGRNLHYLNKGSVGVDHNPFSIQTARDAGLTAYTSEEFFATGATPLASFDSMLSAHVVEHLEPQEAIEILGSYVPYIKPGGKVVFITPQERGYASDATHVAFSDLVTLRKLSEQLGLRPARAYSFPFPRFVGKFFTYNEFVHVSIV
ncbi:MAG: class I SAM-dependent methyltransferase [Salinibacterium sp.]|nr:class I SAM-dependent methyltransferase [Salinibacterium sp.]